MTIRRALHAMLDRGGDGAGDGGGDGDAGAPRASTIRDALDRAGFGDVPAELIGTAVGHYADSAELAHADTLAPFATEASSIPFDDSLDSPDVFEDAHDVDPMDVLDAADSVEVDGKYSGKDDEPDESTVDDNRDDDEDDDPFEFGMGSNDSPDRVEAVEAVEDLDDGSTGGVGFSIEEPAAFSDVHDRGGAMASTPEYDGADPDDLDAGLDDDLDGFDNG